MRNKVGSACSSTYSAGGRPRSPPATSGAPARHSIWRRSDTRLVPCTRTLHTIMSGTASLGGRTCRRTAPATAEKANPEKPDTTAPAKTPSASSTCEKSPATCSPFPPADIHCTDDVRFGAHSSERPVTNGIHTQAVTTKSRVKNTAPAEAGDALPPARGGRTSLRRWKPTRFGTHSSCEGVTDGLPARRRHHGLQRRERRAQRWISWYRATVLGAGDMPSVAASVFSQRLY